MQPGWAMWLVFPGFSLFLRHGVVRDYIISGHRVPALYCLHRRSAHGCGSASLTCMHQNVVLLHERCTAAWLLYRRRPVWKRCRRASLRSWLKRKRKLHVCPQVRLGSCCRCFGA